MGNWPRASGTVHESDVDHIAAIMKKKSVHQQSVNYKFAQSLSRSSLARVRSTGAFTSLGNELRTVRFRFSSSVLARASCCIVPTCHHRPRTAPLGFASLYPPRLHPAIVRHAGAPRLDTLIGYTLFSPAFPQAFCFKTRPPASSPPRPTSRPCTFVPLPRCIPFLHSLSRAPQVIAFN
jgi:hypothetical protein